MAPRPKRNKARGDIPGYAVTFEGNTGQPSPPSLRSCPVLPSIVREGLRKVLEA